MIEDKKNKYKFSIIIPHYNSNNLLRRTLNSIPRRNDIEVIVVDDFSTENSIKIISNENEYNHVNFIFPNRKVTSGGARNIGLDNANGEYVIFADSDDYFSNNAFNIFDRYAKSLKEFYQFRADSFLEETKEIGSGTRVKNLYKFYELENREGLINIQTPWAKLIRRDFIEKFHIRFSEVPPNHGDDNFFSVQVALYTENYEYSKDIVYLVSQGIINSTHKHDDSSYVGLLKEAIKCNKLICKVNNINLFVFFKDIKNRRWFELKNQVNSPEYNLLLNVYNRSLPYLVRIYWRYLLFLGKIQSPQLHFASSNNIDVCYVLREGKKRELIVNFNNFGSFENGVSESKKYPYNFVNNISKSQESILDIRDFFGSNGGYYLIENGIVIDDDINECIGQTMSILGIGKDNVTLIGSGKGGSAALHYIKKYGYKNFLVYKPHLKVGDYLNQTKYCPVLDSMIGNLNKTDAIKMLNSLVDLEYLKNNKYINNTNTNNDIIMSNECNSNTQKYINIISSIEENF